MSEAYTKCSCRVCGGHIEFPSQAVGMSIGCPHCGATTDLYAEPPIPVVRLAGTAPAPPPPAPSPPRLQVQGGGYAPQAPASAVPRLQVAAPPPPPPSATPDYAEYTEATPAARGPINWIGWSLATVSILLFVVGSVMYLSNVKQGKTTTLKSLRSSTVKPSKADVDEESEPGAPVKPAKATARAKAIEDLKAGPITLQRAGGGSRVVYAVGTLRNDSDFQRFGVKIELDLLDASGNPVLLNGKPATAKDYVQVIEPHRDWRFRALIVAPRTASVRVAKITEEP